MLFLESNLLSYTVDGSTRTKLLHALQEQNFVPLIRAARLRAYDALLVPVERLTEFESSLSSWTEAELKEPFVAGDIFVFDDHILFLTFSEPNEEASLRAGIIFQANTPEPFRKLDSFCQKIKDILLNDADGQESEVPKWQAGKQTVPEGFRSFVAKQDVDSLYTSLRKETMTKRIVAASKLEDDQARHFLRTARDANLEGYAAKLLTGDTTPINLSIDRLEDVGLVERKVQVSCRKTGHAIVQLPNPHALAVVTVSDATCSECGSPVADESVEEVIAPTQLASSLLEDGSWLISRLHFLLREMGVPEREIALGPSDGTGYGQMMANICGESFLLLTRDGDLTPAFARWAIDLELETEACHLVIVAPGRIHREAGVLLQNHSRRRISSGEDFEMILADDVATAGQELKDALERVSQRVLGEQLCVLDNSLGLNVTKLVLTKFELRASSSEITDQEPATAETEPEFSSPTLALAANASAGSEIVNIDPVVIDVSATEIDTSTEMSQTEPTATHVDFDTRSWS
ncbi:MAG: hypothetical protein C5B55_08700 [Blastocatellia bacterium]|nr:MAG: hypothetical protein C5B55_08700 [Blastocatellia bacterium]